jgi:hypothetical protein
MIKPYPGKYWRCWWLDFLQWRILSIWRFRCSIGMRVDSKRDFGQPKSLLPWVELLLFLSQEVFVLLMDSVSQLLFQTGSLKVGIFRYDTGPESSRQVTHRRTFVMGPSWFAWRTRSYAIFHAVYASKRTLLTYYSPPWWPQVNGHGCLLRPTGQALDQQFTVL